jgi:endonuclease/exonuclease/phosphatase family metal-dependent hydrolase
MRSLFIRFYAVVTLSILCFSVFGQNTQLEIWQIQGNGFASAYADSTVTTQRNIVTFVRNDRFFIQTPPERTDNNPATSNGIMVYVGDQPSVEVGDLVTVSGQIQEYFQLTEFGPDNLSISIDSTGVSLPESIVLESIYFPDTIQPFHFAERFEGMRVSFDSMQVYGPSDNSNAYVSFSPERTFREPNLPFFDATMITYFWDNNPELLQINTQGTGTLPLSVGMEVSGQGVLSWSNGTYQIFAEELFASGEAVYRPVREKIATEATIGSLNCYVFSIQEPDFAARQFKLARYIIDNLRSPDILAVQEVRDLATLEALADKIQELEPDIQYQAFLELGNQSGSFQINNGFLIRNTVQNIQISQWGEDEVLSLGGLLHDRPPLLLEGELSTNPPVPIRVLNLHLRSLGGIEGSNADYVRTKRWEQSLSVANIMRDLQYGNLIVVGDFNAFQFSDGYVDVLAQLTGTPTTGAEYPVIEDIIEVPITNHSALLPQEELYSFVFRGNAQILDHCLTNELTDLTINELQYARGNSDNSDEFVDNTFVPYRAADHDGLVLYLGLNDSLTVTNNDFENIRSSIHFPNPFNQNSNIELSLAESQTVILELVDLSGRMLFRSDLGTLGQGIHHFTPQWRLPPGMYFLRLRGSKGEKSKKLIIQ